MMRARSISWIVATALALGGSVACDKLMGNKDDAEEEESDKKTSKSKKEESEEPKQAASAEEKKEGETKPATGENSPDLTAILGGKGSGFAPVVFAKLKEDMTPQQAAGIMPGADKPDEFGFADLPQKNVAGIDKYRLSYQEGKLKFAEIMFAGALKNDDFWKTLVTHLKDKLAPVEMKELGPKHVMWIAPSMNSITLSEGITDPGFVLQYAVEP